MSEPQALSVVQAPAPRTGVGTGHYLALLAIVALGITLRFTLLDRPTLWGDEAATWARTCGTFQEMLTGNQADGFVPLHYELYWAMGKMWTLTPWRMRLVPAIAGTLMVPAMYFLARQLVRPRAALIAALFAATSAYLLNYSRDAKMYMHTWLFLTLHVASLLWWLRGGGGVAWWSWLSCGVASVGLHASAWLLMPVEVLILATYGRPRVLRWLLFAAGAAIIGAGPWYYYQYYNTWAEKSGGILPSHSARGAQGNWFQSGISWIDRQTRDKTGPELVRESATAYLCGYSRAEEELGPDGTIPIPLWVLNLAWGTLAGIILVMLLGLVRWPSREPPSTQSVWTGWQLLLWIGAWLAIPTVSLYCRSALEPASALDWIHGFFHYFSWQLLWMTSLAVGLALLARQNAIRRVTAWSLFALFGTCIIYSLWRGGVMWYMVLVELAYRPWLVGGLAAIGAAVSWSSCSQEFRLRLKLALAGLAAVVLLLAMCELSWRIWDHLRRVAEHSPRPIEWHSIWMPRYLAVVWPAVAITLVIAICRLPGRALKIIAVAGIVAANLAQFIAHIKLDPEPRIDLMAIDLVKAERDPRSLVYVADRTGFGAPGAGTIADATGRYYISLGLGRTPPPFIARHGPTDHLLRQLRRMTSVRWIINELTRKPEVSNLVIWQRSSQQRDPEDALDKALGPDWRKVSETTYTARRHWNWQHMDDLRRIEYARPSATTRPSDQR